MAAGLHRQVGSGHLQLAHDAADLTMQGRRDTSPGQASLAFLLSFT